MKKAIIFTAADVNNLPYAQMLEKTLRKFHPEEIEFRIYGPDEVKAFKDPQFFYRQKPAIMRSLINEYETVIGIDADSLILGDISLLWKHEGFDVGTVLNINRVDPQIYGLIPNNTGMGIAPNEYYNCGLVVARSKKFINQWWDICNSKYFERFQYREQDVLNILCAYGGYQVHCFDHYDAEFKSSCMWGLVSKGEWHHAIIKGKDVVLPRGKDNYPDRDTVLKVLHFAGGGNEKKMEYKTKFSEEVVEYINSLVT